MRIGAAETILQAHGHIWDEADHFMSSDEVDNLQARVEQLSSEVQSLGDEGFADLMREVEENRAEHSLATQVNVPDELLPDGEGWEQAVLSDEGHNEMLDDSGLVLFTRLSPETGEPEYHAVLTIPPEKAHLFAALDGEEFAALGMLEDEEKPYALSSSAENVKVGLYQEGSAYHAAITGNITAGDLSDSEALDAALQEHFMPLLGKSS